MGRLLSKQFIATHQQIGRFDVVDNHGVLQKQGGNVASCFCTADGRVIHLVLGPVAADVLLDEAQWALDAAKHVTADAQASARSIAELHQEARNHPSSRGRGQNNRVHDFLANHPLERWDSISGEIFTKLLNEKIEPIGTQVSDIAAAFESAKERALPILWILDDAKASGQSLEHWKRQVAEDSETFGALAETYAVIALPFDEAPALSSKLKLRPFAAPDRGRPLFVVTRSNGKQLTAVTTWNKPSELSAAMLKGLIQEAKERPRSTDQLKSLANKLRALDPKLPREIKALPTPRPTRQKKESSTRSSTLGKK